MFHCMSWRVLLFLLWQVLSVAPVAQAQQMSVTLLGTGSPSPVLDRFGPSTLVEAGTQQLVFDVGRGALQRLRQVGVGYDRIDAVFLTHLHSDHIVGLPDLWLVGWLISQRTEPLKVFGPTGTAKMVEHLKQAFEVDRQARLDENAPLLLATGGDIQVVEIAPGVVYDVDGVRVAAIPVDHRAIAPAFGYRVDWSGRSVVLSGDTRRSEPLVKQAQGADVLIHEVYDAPDEYFVQTPRALHIQSFHVSAAEAGSVFASVRPKLAVYSHIVLRGGLDAEGLIRRTRARYDGPLVVGEDLLKIEIGSEVKVVRP